MHPDDLLPRPWDARAQHRADLDGGGGTDRAAHPIASRCLIESALGMLHLAPVRESVAVLIVDSTRMRFDGGTPGAARLAHANHELDRRLVELCGATDTLGRLEPWRHAVVRVHADVGTLGWAAAATAHLRQPVRTDGPSLAPDLSVVLIHLEEGASWDSATTLVADIEEAADGHLERGRSGLAVATIRRRVSR